MPLDEADPTTRRAMLRVGATLREKWKIERLLGVGGMAAVYAGTHRNGKRGAIKVMHRELSLDAEATRRFMREGYVANTVDHPGAVSVIDDDVAEDGSFFLVMELLEGESVEQTVERRPGRRLRLLEVLDIADQTLDVLGAAHAKGIVHRDVKPENLFLTRRGEVKILDFGIARLRGLTNSKTGTKAGSTMGTPSFMPPEQALGDWDDVDGRSDLWAVGATMFTLLTGRLVHEEDTVQKMLLAAMTKSAPPLRGVLPDFPVAVCAVVDKALAFHQKDRFADARAMQLAVRGVRAMLPAELGGTSPMPAAPPPLRDRSARDEGSSAVTLLSTAGTGGRSSRRLVAFAVVGAVVLAGGVITLLEMIARPAAPSVVAEPLHSATSLAGALASGPPPTVGPASAAPAPSSRPAASPAPSSPSNGEPAPSSPSSGEPAPSSPSSGEPGPVTPPGTAHPASGGGPGAAVSAASTSLPHNTSPSAGATGASGTRKPNPLDRW